jgi:hypothetical protein
LASALAAEFDSVIGGLEVLKRQIDNFPSTDKTLVWDESFVIFRANAARLGILGLELDRRTVTAFARIRHNCSVAVAATDQLADNPKIKNTMSKELDYLIERTNNLISDLERRAVGFYVDPSPNVSSANSNPGKRCSDSEQTNDN